MIVVVTVKSTILKFYNKCMQNLTELLQELSSVYKALETLPGTW